MSRYDKLSRPATLVVATLVAVLTLAVTARAVQTITTANAAFIAYSLGPGANSPSIGVPANQATLVMGVCNTFGFRGVGFVTMQHIIGSFLEWVGLESTAGAAITQGFGSTGHIVFIDFGHQVDIQANGPDTFIVHNGSTGARAGNVKLIW